MPGTAFKLYTYTVIFNVYMVALLAIHKFAHALRNLLRVIALGIRSELYYIYATRGIALQSPRDDEDAAPK